ARGMGVDVRAANSAERVRSREIRFLLVDFRRRAAAAFSAGAFLGGSPAADRSPLRTNTFARGRFSRAWPGCRILRARSRARGDLVRFYCNSLVCRSPRHLGSPAKSVRGIIVCRENLRLLMFGRF